MNVHVSDHAVERYQERVRDIELVLARPELEALAFASPVVTELPPWAKGKYECDGAAVISDGILLLLRREARQWVAMTCVVRGSVPPKTRERRNHRNAVLRRAAKARKRRKGGRPEREWARASAEQSAPSASVRRVD